MKVIMLQLKTPVVFSWFFNKLWVRRNHNSCAQKNHKKFHAIDFQKDTTGNLETKKHSYVLKSFSIFVLYPFYENKTFCFLYRYYAICRVQGNGSFYRVNSIPKHRFCMGINRNTSY